MPTGGHSGRLAPPARRGSRLLLDGLVPLPLLGRLAPLLTGDARSLLPSGLPLLRPALAPPLLPLPDQGSTLLRPARSRPDPPTRLALCPPADARPRTTARPASA